MQKDSELYHKIFIIRKTEINLTLLLPYQSTIGVKIVFSLWDFLYSYIRFYYETFSKKAFSKKVQILKSNLIIEVHYIK